MPNIGNARIGWTDGRRKSFRSPLLPTISYRDPSELSTGAKWRIVLRQRPTVFLPNFVHKSKLFLALLPFSAGCNQSSMMLVRYLRAPCCPHRRSNFPTHPYSKFHTSAPLPSSISCSGKVAKKFPPLDFHNRSHTSSAAVQTRRPKVDQESKVQLVSKWKMSFRKFLIAARRHPSER